MGPELGPYPYLWDLVVSPDGTRIYATDSDAYAVRVIDAATGELEDTIPVGNDPLQLAISADGSRLYVTNNNDNTVSVIDTLTNAVIATVNVDGEPEGLALTPTGDYLWVANYNGDSITIIDTSDNSVDDTIAVAGGPTGIVFANGKAFVSLWDTNHVAVINVGTRTVDNTVAVGVNPYYSAASLSGDLAYIANYHGGTVSVIDTASGTVVGTVGVGTEPGYVAVSPDGSRLYVTNYLSDTVSIVDTATNVIIQTIDVDGPWGLAMSPTLPEAYVGLWTEGIIRILFEVAPVITSGTLANGAVGSSYSQPIVHTGVPVPTFSITGGALPPGLSLNSATGVVSGIPGAVGTYTFTVLASSVVYGSSESDEQEITITIVLADTGVEPTPYIAGAVLLASLGAMLLAARRRHLA